DILAQGGWAALMSLTVFVPAALLRVILEYLESPGEMSRGAAWLCVGALLVSSLATAIADAQCQWAGAKIRSKLRAVLINEVYSKVLRKRMAQPVHESSGADATPASSASNGNILNLMSSDVEVVSGMSGFLYMVWVNFPVQIAIAIYLFYQTLGISGVIGIVLMVVLLPLNNLVSRRAVAAQTRVLAASDARIQANTEVINSIRTIKYCGWETAFKNRVLELRRTELVRLRSQFMWWSITQTLFHSFPFIVTILTFFFYTVVFGNELGTSTAFPALAMFGVLRIPLDRMADSITFLLQAHVSVLRLDKFLREGETEKYSQLSTSNVLHIGFDNATFEWPSHTTAHASEEQTTPGQSSASTSAFRLHDVQIHFKNDSLNVLSGPSGSGKSSLLLALLGEMHKLKGQVLFSLGEPWQVAYCPQEPWILNRSIRANIILGLSFNSLRYEAVLRAVALRQDLEALDQGDQTLAGENGSRLSGGQKQRVALARALYSRAKYILLDDCLSALDARTASHVFFHAVKGRLMRNRTCIFATHHVKLAVPEAEYVVLLNEGRIRGQGTPGELVSAGFLGADILENSEASDGSEEDSTDSDTADIDFDNHQFQVFPRSSDSVDDEEASEQTEPKYQEGKREGAVPWPVLRNFLLSMGSHGYWIIVLVGFVSQQLVALGTNLWIQRWAQEYDSSEKPDGRAHKVNAGYYLAVYGGIALGYALISLLRNAVALYGSLRASSRIYERLLSSVLHAKLTFFDHTPLGQILNRFSGDVSAIDKSLTGFLISAFQLVISIAVGIGIISVVIPVFLPMAAIICLGYYSVVLVYINSSRDIKRIQSVERSPLYQQLGETLNGFVSIRAYDQGVLFANENHNLVDRLQQPGLLLGAAQEWLSLRIGSISGTISFIAGAFTLLSMGSVSPGAAGLMLTYAATFTENVMWLAQVYSIIQQNLNSAERLSEYIDVEQEATQPLKTPALADSAQWPSQGSVHFQNYTTRYAPELEPVLKGVTFEARPGQRIAIVGRTGAGKSTLALALIRGLEAESGHIDVDGVDVASVPLERLRRMITVVPQDPTLFEGTIRNNLDPLHEHTDDDILAMLRTVHLLRSLDQDVQSGDTAGVETLDRPAEALSRGQRQLLCIARALLRRSRVLVLDEATASIDHATDELIQQGLRASTATGTTVLTVAHRLQTIADYDWVVVLDSGRVVEQGKVLDLLAHEGETAVFRKLCEDSGSIDAIRMAASPLIVVD
ncbi:putative multidrug resistance protein, partial [Thozetella sp. PMI_491]